MDVWFQVPHNVRPTNRALTEYYFANVKLVPIRKTGRANEVLYLCLLFGGLDSCNEKHLIPLAYLTQGRQGRLDKGIVWDGRVLGRVPEHDLEISAHRHLELYLV